MEGAFRTFLDRDLPRLIDADLPEATYDALTRIREELRHVFYHLLDSEFQSFGLLLRSNVGAIDETALVFLVAFMFRAVAEVEVEVLRRTQNLNFLRSSSAVRYRWFAKAA